MIAKGHWLMLSGYVLCFSGWFIGFGIVAGSIAAQAGATFFCLRLRRSEPGLWMLSGLSTILGAAVAILMTDGLFTDLVCVLNRALV
jgi:hypothetical protein